MKTPEELWEEWCRGKYYSCPAEFALAKDDFLAGLRAGLEMAAEVAEDYWCTDDAIEAIRIKAEEVK